MAQKYRKVDPRIWGDEKFVGLESTDKLITLYCLTSSQVNRIGIFRFSMGLAAEEVGTLPATFAKRFHVVCQTFGWGFHEPTKTLYFPTWWKYNRPDNPNMLEAWLRDLHDVPTSPLIARFCENDRYLPDKFAIVLRKVGLNVTPNVTPNPSPQEQEQEQEQEYPLKSPKGENGKFIPPTIEQVSTYCSERHNDIDAQTFIDYYTVRDWKPGNCRTRMKDWKAAVRTWEKNRIAKPLLPPDEEDIVYAN